MYIMAVIVSLHTDSFCVQLQDQRLTNSVQPININICSIEIK